MRFVSLVGPVLAFSIVAFTGSQAIAQSSKEFFGPEETLFIACDWRSGPTERSITQIEEVRFRETFQKLEDGEKFTSVHVGTYLGDLKVALDRRLGVSSTDCRTFPSGQYKPDYTPGSTYEAAIGGMWSLVLHKVDPSWFVVNRLTENAQVVSLGHDKQAAVSDPPVRPLSKSARPLGIIVSDVEPIKPIAPPAKPTPPLPVNVPKPPPARIICNAPEGVSCVIPQ